MKTMIKASALAIAPIAAVALVPVAHSQTVSTVAVADLEEAEAKTNAAVLANNQINITYKAQIDAAQAKANAYNTELAGLRAEIQALQKATPPNQALIAQKVEAYQKRQQFAQADVQNMSGQFQLATAYAKSQLDAKLEAAVKAAMAKKGVKLLLKPEALIIAADGAPDITMDITTELNSLVPSVSTAVPAGWPNAAGAAPAAGAALPPPVAPAPGKKPTGR